MKHLKQTGSETEHKFNNIRQMENQKTSQVVERKHNLVFRYQTDYAKRLNSHKNQQQVSSSDRCYVIIHRYV